MTKEPINSAHSKQNRHVSNESEYPSEYIRIIDDEWKLINDEHEIDKHLPEMKEVQVKTGISDIQCKTLKRFESLDLSESINHRRGYVFHTGGSIWGIDFLPQPDKSVQYVAIGGYRTAEEHYGFENDMDPEKRHNAIQIWSYRDSSTPDTQCLPVLEMCLLHEYGAICNLQWHPVSIYKENNTLGILIALFTDGVIRVFVVPHPAYLRQNEDSNDRSTIYVKAEKPRLLFALPKTKMICFSLGCFRKLACGTSRGSIFVWDIMSSLSENKPVLSIGINDVSKVPITNVTWRDMHNEEIVFSVDMNGNFSLHDLKDPFLMVTGFRLRLEYTPMVGTGDAMGFVYADSNDDTVKINQVLGAVNSIEMARHYGRIWDIAISPYHNIAASVSYNGVAIVSPIPKQAFGYKPKVKRSEYILYVLHYNFETKCFRYIDGLKSLLKVPYRGDFSNCIDSVHSLQKVNRSIIRKDKSTTNISLVDCMES
ncbi:MAG: hypothetical protein EXX96DRAFT_546652 [Benjaminiella poitrasii]|nr:MAG: hypothetical protein EXX96DRAFT_546652 [Benjaminiella poitrasii]